MFVCLLIRGSCGKSFSLCHIHVCLKFTEYSTSPITENSVTGYPHDSRADKNSYPHDRRADKDSYPHDVRADKDSYPHDRHKQYITNTLC